MLTSTALVLLLPIDPSQAASSNTFAPCRVVLPKEAIPDDPGYFISIEEVAISPGHDGPRVSHEPVEYVYVVSGTGSMSMDGKPDTPLKPGSVVVLPSRTVHQTHNASSSAPLVYTMTFLETSRERTLTTFVGEPEQNSGCPHVIK